MHPKARRGCVLARNSRRAKKNFFFTLYRVEWLTIKGRRPRILSGRAPFKIKPFIEIRKYKTSPRHSVEHKIYSDFMID